MRHINIYEEEGEEELHSILISALDGDAPRPVYLRGKSPRYPFKRSLGRPHIWSERFAEEKSPLSVPVDEPRIVTPLVESLGAPSSPSAPLYG